MKVKYIKSNNPEEIFKEALDYFKKEDDPSQTYARDKMMELNQMLTDLNKSRSILADELSNLELIRNITGFSTYFNYRLGYLKRILDENNSAKNNLLITLYHDEIWIDQWGEKEELINLIKHDMDDIFSDLNSENKLSILGKVFTPENIFDSKSLDLFNELNISSREIFGEWFDAQMYGTDFD